MAGSSSLDDVKFFRIVWVDSANVIRAKERYATTESLPIILTDGIAVTAGLMSFPPMFDLIVPGTGQSASGEIFIIPDRSTIRRLPYIPRHVRAFGDMYLDGKPWSYDPRGFLKRMVHQAHIEFGLEFKAAFENEFFILDKDGNVPYNSVYAQVYSMDRSHQVIDSIVDYISEQGITVEQYHPESGPSQHEVAVKYDTALTTADNQVIIREAVHAGARGHNMTATFIPKLLEDTAGSGTHVHFSLWRDGRSLLGKITEGTGFHFLKGEEHVKWGMRREVRAFAAGVLAHLPALVAITTPSTLSFRRLQPGFWAGAYMVWGIQNREAAIRPCSTSDGTITNIELKTSDASANPYLVLGAIIAAGLDGLRKNMELNDPVDGDPSRLSPEEREKHNIHLLPRSLHEAVGHLRNDSVLTGALGEDLARAYIAVKEYEAEYFKDKSFKEQVDMLKYRY